MTIRSKKLSKDAKTLKKLRSSIGWTRARWINEAQSVLGGAMILWFEIQLVQKYGQRRLVRGMMTEFDRRLAIGMIDLSVHLVRREFDRAVAFEKAITGMETMADSLRRYVEERFVARHGSVRRGLDDADLRDLWRRARQEMAVVFSDRVASGSPRSSSTAT